MTIEKKQVTYPEGRTAIIDVHVPAEKRVRVFQCNACGMEQRKRVYLQMVQCQSCCVIEHSRAVTTWLEFESKVLA